MPPPSRRPGWQPPQPGTTLTGAASAANVGPGLDVARLRALRESRRDLDAIVGRIGQHLEQHDGYVAFSTGKDSLAVLHLARQTDPNVPVAFFDSGLEYPETYRYLEQLQQRWRLNLDVVSAQPTALQVLAATGTWDHRAPDGRAVDLRDALITRPAALAHARHGPGELWGIRSDEAGGRAALHARSLRAAAARDCHGCCDDARAQRRRHGGTVERRDGTTAYSPVWDWSSSEVWNHLYRTGAPINPVYAKLRRLGAPERSLRLSLMVDGAHLETGRLTWLRRGWPDVFEDLATVLPRIREYV